VLPSETQVIPFFVILTFKIYLRQQTGDLSHKFNRMLTRRKMIFVEIKEKRMQSVPSSRSGIRIDTIVSWCKRIQG
ncbi:MAG: hypothetical protein LDL06_04975, partial [Candidatus Nitrosotenuis sp.]|nr:hypothetical protein [Candidatus Nitrosotenuis sp.]